MKFSVQREALLKPLQYVIGVVERRQTLPVLSNLLVQVNDKGLTLTGTDLEVELVGHLDVQVDTPGEITVPARKLADICRTLPEEAELTIRLDGDRVRVQSGRSRFTLASLPAAEFPNLEDIQALDQFSLAQADLKRLIDRTQFSMAQQDVRYYLNGLMLELGTNTLRTVATDGHRLALCEMASPTTRAETRQVIVPRKGIMELGRLLEDSEATVEIFLGQNHLRVMLPDLQFTSKLIDGKFPDYQRVLPARSDTPLLADREVLRQALIRASILSNEKYRGVRLVLEGESLRIQAHNPEQEEAEEELSVEYAGQPMEIGFNVNYLMDALSHLPGSVARISMHDSNSSCLIEETEDAPQRYVVMPMRL